MRVFFGTLRVLISQMSYDIYIRLYDLFVVWWETRYDILKRIVVIISIIVTLLFDAWIFWMLYIWAEHPVVLTFLIIGTIMVMFLQVGAWIDRKRICTWLLNRWSRASQTYRHRRADVQVAKMHDDQVSEVGKMLDACRDSTDLNKTINDRSSL